MIDENEIVMEVWRPVEDFPNYEVSDQGRVRNIKTGRILKPSNNGHGYLQVVLCQNGERTCHILHRLVAMAFVKNPARLPQVNHINEVIVDNRACNLEWCDQKYNNNYGTRTERAALSKSKPVEQYDLDGNYIRTWISAREAEKRTGAHNSAISGCCNGKVKTAGGFIWKFAKKID